ncbi:MAG: hypothetical protein JZU65_23710 [Chlorobium sp.]|nr:hypothetical protein [Chlorobium sp.]
MNADQIREIIREELQAALAAFFVSANQATPTPLSVNDQALQLLRQGRREESVALLKAHSKRRAA